jgi:RNA polymerase sigma-70 factor (ECF subfamily)
MLRARKSQEVAVEALSDQSAWSGEADLEQEHLTAELVSLALLVVLEKLKPAERVAFVLHDVFDVPFEEIAPIIDHTPISARQLASRARRRVRGEPAVPPAALSGKRQIMAAFLDAVRAGDMDTIMALLDPSVVLRADASVTPGGTAVEVRGSTTVAKGALTFAARTRFASPMLVNGGPGIVVAPHGQVRSVLLMDIAEERIRTIEVFGDPARLAQMDFALIGDRN